MVRRAILKFSRGVALICFCILGLAAIVAILELLALPTLLKATGCGCCTEILPTLTCGVGWVNRSIEIVLNLPFLFFYALVFSYERAFSPITSPPSREFMLLLYLFDAILILALTYLLLILFARKKGRPGS
jgi:hypothetical protein